jgi:hypothetical protein
MASIGRIIKRAAKYAILGGLLVCISAAIFVYSGPDFRGLLAWAHQQGIPRGEGRSLDPPWYLWRGCCLGEISAARRQDDSYVLLVKTSIGWKQNYDGYVVSERPLAADELFKGYYERDCINVNGLDWSDPIVRRQLDDTTYEVFFDLN